MADFVIKRGDTRPALAAQLKDEVDGAAGVVIDLTSASGVKLIMKLQSSQTATVNAACSFVDRAQGRVLYTWVTQDTGTAGLYDTEFEITWNDGGKETVPNATVVTNNRPYYVVEITGDLG